MVAPDENILIRSCFVLLNDRYGSINTILVFREVIEYLNKEKKMNFLRAVGLESKHHISIISDNVLAHNFSKRCKERRKLLLRRAKRQAEQPFIHARRDSLGGLYFKLRRHLMENLKNAIIRKIICKSCQVILTPISKVNGVLDASDDTSNSSYISKSSRQDVTSADNSSDFSTSRNLDGTFNVINFSSVQINRYVCFINFSCNILFHIL